MPGQSAVGGTDPQGPVGIGEQALHGVAAQAIIAPEDRELLAGEAVLDEVRVLVRNMVAMHEILRDREHVSLRLVMNPDRMVIDEARRKAGI